MHRATDSRDDDPVWVPETDRQTGRQTDRQAGRAAARGGTTSALMLLTLSKRAMMRL